MQQAYNFSSEPLPQKYKVFKIDSDEQLSVGEFFVLRKQDMLAVHTLWNYISNLRLAYELVKDDGDAQKMLELADQVASMATEWQMSDDHTKLPD